MSSPGASAGGGAVQLRDVSRPAVAEPPEEPRRFSGSMRVRGDSGGSGWFDRVRGADPVERGKPEPAGSAHSADATEPGRAGSAEDSKPADSADSADTADSAEPRNSEGSAA